MRTGSDRRSPLHLSPAAWRPSGGTGDRWSPAFKPVAPLVLSALVCAVGLGSAGCRCAPPERRAPSEGQGPVSLTPPARADTSDERAATLSFLQWMAYAYRMADSNVASATMTPQQAVRIDSYIELNRQKGQLLEQRLVSFDVRSVRRKGRTSTLTARELWRYRYVDLSTGQYRTAPAEASYATTYTLVRASAGWLVDRVEASPIAGRSSP